MRWAVDCLLCRKPISRHFELFDHLHFDPPRRKWDVGELLMRKELVTLTKELHRSTILNQGRGRQRRHGRR
jgi:hypothetical protein